MKAAYVRRPQDFTRRIIARVITTRLDLLIEELRWLRMIKDHELRDRYYNLRNGHTGHWAAYENAGDIRDRISLKTKEAMARPDVREKYLEGLKTRKWVESEKRIEGIKRNWAVRSPIETRTPKIKYGSDYRDHPDYQKNVSEGIKRTWQDPEVRKKRLQNMKSQKGQVRPTMRAKKWWNNGSQRVRAEECPGDGWVRGQGKR